MRTLYRTFGRGALSPAFRALVLGSVLLAVVAVGGLGCPRFLNLYVVSRLVSDGAVSANHTDANLVNAWGVALTPSSFVWVADNGTGLSTVYDGAGNAQSIVATIPSASGEGTGVPTGIVANTTNSFAVSAGEYSTPAPATFLFATEDGLVVGWNATVDATHAVIGADRSDQNAVFKGLALASTNDGDFLFATDFHNNRIDVFDSEFDLMTDTGFVDDQIPDEYGPFGITNLQGKIFVSYAQADDVRHDDVHGAGLGFVDVYSTQGQLLQRLIQHGNLNAPWGMVIAPASFGRFRNDLLVGNFGDGKINAYSPSTGAFDGQLQDASRAPIVIDGLWGLVFGNGEHGQPTNTLFFAAGPNEEADGLFGRIAPCR